MEVRWLCFSIIIRLIIELHKSTVEKDNMEAEFISFDLYHPQPLLIIISGPSGVGKDAVVRTLQRRETSLHFVVTATSRPMRAGEVDGVDYIFVSEAQFEDMIAHDDLLEYAVVYQQYKGIPKSQVRDAMASGKDVIMRIDVQGAATVRKLCPEAVLIFLIPSNQAEWIQRLMERRTETPESMKLRVKTAQQELTRMGEFDYVVVNAQDCLDEAVDAIEAIIEAEHHRVSPRKLCL
jgi:guanylate kinase